MSILTPSWSTVFPAVLDMSLPAALDVTPSRKVSVKPTKIPLRDENIAAVVLFALACPS